MNNWTDKQGRRIDARPNAWNRFEPSDQRGRYDDEIDLAPDYAAIRRHYQRQERERARGGEAIFLLAGAIAALAVLAFLYF